MLDLKNIEAVVRQALGVVASMDGDRARERNDVGFSQIDGGIGHGLVNTPSWSPKQLAAALRLAIKYRRQHGIPLPDCTPEGVLGEAVQQRDNAPTVVTTTTLPEWGIQWGAPRTLNTRQGIRSLREGAPTDAFWAEWKTNKEGMRAMGYGVGRTPSGWAVQHWSAPTPAPREIAEAKSDPSLIIPSVDASKLRPWQIAAVRADVRSLVIHGAALNGSDTGTGKTYMACATVRTMLSYAARRPGRWLVLTPKSVRPDFERVGKFFDLDSRRMVVSGYEKVRTGNTNWGEWTEFQYGGKLHKRFVWSEDVAGIVFDEAHRCKGLTTQNSKMMVSARYQGIPTLALSATAVESPLDLKALGYLLGMHNLTDFYDWAASHGCFQNRWDGWEFSGSNKIMAELRAQVWPEHGSRIRVEDLGDKFPQTVITTKLIEVPDVDAVKAAWVELGKTIEEIEEKAKGDKTGAEHLTRMLRARQVVEVQKIPGILDLAGDKLDQGRKIVIGVNFRETLEALRKSLAKDSRRVGVIHGEITGEDRQAVIDAFRAGKIDVVILVLQAGGEGVSLHGPNRISILSPPWAARLAKQFWGRIHRDGGDHSVQYVLYAAGTVEENVADRMQAKLDRMMTFNNGLPDLEDKDLAA